MTFSISDALASLQASSDHWLSLLEAMVSIDSGPGDVAGAERMVELLGGLWSGMGWSSAAEATQPPVIVARRPGPGPRVMLIGHYDSVFPTGTAAARPFRIADGRATGPGVSDMKAGLVVQAAAMSVLPDERCDLTVLINGDEESGSVGSRPLIERLSAGADLALVFEPGEPDGAFVTGRPGVRRFRVGTVGRAAHTGVEPELGRNAIEGLAHLVLAISDLGRRGDLGTVTVSQIHGGARPNIVPAEASAVIDGRIATEDDGDRLAAELDRLAASVPVADVSGWVERLEARPAFFPTDRSSSVVATLAGLGASAGIAVEARPARGSSDGNFTAGLGIPTLDGAGPAGGGFHTDHEWADVDGIFTRAALVAGLIAAVGE